MARLDPDYARYAAWKAWDELAFMAPAGDERAALAAELNGLDLAGRDVLDLGFGNGALLALAREAGATLHGTEVQPALAERAAAAGVTLLDPDLARALPAHAGRFALIGAIDLLEHQEPAALPALFATLADLLADGGHLLARVPNGQSPFGRVYQHGDLTHRAILSADIVRQLIADLPLDVVRLGNPARPAGLVAVLRHAAQGLHEFAIHKLYGLSAPMAPNTVALLRRRARSTSVPVQDEGR